MNDILLDNYLDTIQEDASWMQNFKLGDTRDIPGGAGQVVKFGILAAAITALGYKVYKSYISKASRSCKSRPDKEKCMKEYKQKAIIQQIRMLQKNKKYCNKSSNPHKCANKVDKKIISLKDKL